CPMSATRYASPCAAPTPARPSSEIAATSRIRAHRQRLGKARRTGWNELAAPIDGTQTISRLVEKPGRPAHRSWPSTASSEARERAHLDASEAREVTVLGDERAGAMLEAHRGDLGVEDCVAACTRAVENLAQQGYEGGTGRQQADRGTRE